MDFILEEEMIDILTFCLQNPNSDLIESKKQRFKEIGHELFAVLMLWKISFLQLIIEYKVKSIRIQDHFDYYGMVFLMSGPISRENL